MKNVIIGIDTSNYTTSVSAVDLNGSVLANIKYPLLVKSGERGLRQSDAVFSHIKNLPYAMRQIRDIIGSYSPVAIGVSDKPRNQSGSYMPCFLAGVASAESISACLDVPIYKFSHQCGHIMAALYSSSADIDTADTFAAFHISGGTTELVRVSMADNGFSAEIVGGTSDISAGQLIDRIGVMMGLDFPCGRELEGLALSYNFSIPKKKVSGNGMHINLSGIENYATEMYRKSNSKEMVAAFVLNHIADALCIMCDEYIKEYGDTQFVFAGGVMSNSIIRHHLQGIYKANFAEPAMAADNAVGIALLALEKYKK